MWVDQQQFTLRQVQTQVPVPGGFRTITESYDIPSRQSSPVLGPLSVLPVDLPAFLEGSSKGVQEFEYEAQSSPAGTKAVGDIGFAFSIQQSSGEVEPAKVECLVNDAFAKDLTVQPIVEVKLKGVDREVRQLWKAGLPWPSISTTVPPSRG